MRPRERRESGERVRSRLDQIIDAKHALVKLARTIDWRFPEEKFGTVYKEYLMKALPSVARKVSSNPDVTDQPASRRRARRGSPEDRGPRIGGRAEQIVRLPRATGCNHRAERCPRSVHPAPST